MVNVYIKQNEVYSAPLQYILSMLGKNKNIAFGFTDQKQDATLIFDHTDSSSVPVNVSAFNLLLETKVYDHNAYFQDKPLWHFPESNQPDWLGSAFYMVNSFQEFGSGSDPENFDQHNRFRYERSYQHKYNCIEENLVQQCFDHFCSDQPALANAGKKIAKSSRIFLSHDIDTIRGSFLQDGMWALRRGRLDVVMRLMLNEIIARPHWTNIDKIVKLHTEHDLKSTFFWLATKKVADNGVKNADYSAGDIAKLSSLTSSNGLHKSAYTSSLNEELDALPFKTRLNRYHFLKITIPQTWDKLEASRIRFDASLGFAERYGFRNNYGLPFSPYNTVTKTAYNFVEVPLNMMDSTFQRYMQIPQAETADTIIRFIEMHKVGCVLSLLWHNTFFTDYKYRGYLHQYKKVLVYLNESGLQSVTPEQIMTEYLDGKKN